MIYKVKNTYGNELMHYGIKGMKWGKHKAKEYLEEKFKSRKRIPGGEGKSVKTGDKVNDQTNKKANSNKEKGTGTDRPIISKNPADPNNPPRLKKRNSPTDYEVEQTASPKNKKEILKALDKMKAYGEQGDGYFMQIEDGWSEDDGTDTIVVTCGTAGGSDYISYTIKNAGLLKNELRKYDSHAVDSMSKAGMFGGNTKKKN